MRLLSACFWVGAPLVVAAALWSPRTVVLYMGGDVPEFDTPRSNLPPLVADLLYLYRGSAVALGVLVVTTVALRPRARGHVGVTVSLSACFLPTYVAGIESTDHVRWAMRCHVMGPVNLPEFMLGEVQTCAAALACTVIAGTSAAVVAGHRPFPPVVAAILLSVALPWWALLTLVAM